MSAQAKEPAAWPSWEERPAPEDLESAPRSAGHLVADVVTREIGSWRFLLAQGAVLVAWLVVNAAAWVGHWDPYPFILLNLILSFQAAFTAPIILISQNRQAEKDRLTAEHDYRVDRLAEREVEAIGERLDDLAGHQWDALVEMQDRQIALLHQIEALTRDLQSSAGPPETTALVPCSNRGPGDWFRPPTSRNAQGVPNLGQEGEMGWTRKSATTVARERGRSRRIRRIRDQISKEKEVAKVHPYRRSARRV